GEILFEGTLDELMESGTCTGEMMSRNLPFKNVVRQPKGHFRIEHATLHNLKDVCVDLPLGLLCVVAGVAGSGKSSLMDFFRRSYHAPDNIVHVSQKNLGVSLRSTPATYIDVAGDIRKLFAKKNKAKEEMFTFNGKGACPVCGGKGVIVSEMAFMDNIETICEACSGLRYSNEALSFSLVSDTTKERLNIAQAMNLTVRLASRFFCGTDIENKLRPLMDVGLGYLHLNQALSTLSGGELQRLKLASFLGKQAVHSKIFIIDEPTDGLHAKDIEGILRVFDKMVEDGNSVFLVEHNVDVIRRADYAVELGPGAGESGGMVVFQGTPKEMAACQHSITGKYLKVESIK
ncbi:MAG: ATP-binding cassette domain-containing protein, partial [Bacteroidales bacterium]|nr:ATP-binding cassette domain-containing protein [Bacteroidales bacterium]